MNRPKQQRFGGVNDSSRTCDTESKEVVVRPSGFEPPTFCSGAIGTPSNPSCRYLGFQQLGASAFAQPTS